MDFAVEGASGGPRVVGSDSLVQDVDNLRFQVLQWCARQRARNEGAPKGGVLELPASSILNQYLIGPVLVRLRGWARSRFDARHVASPRLLICSDQEKLRLAVEESKARLHFIISLCSQQSVLEVGGCRANLGFSHLAAYDCSLSAEIGLEGMGCVEPLIIMDGLFW